MAFGKLWEMGNGAVGTREKGEMDEIVHHTDIINKIVSKKYGNM